MDLRSSRNRRPTSGLTLKQNMQKEAKTMGDFVTPDRNAPLVNTSFRIAHMAALHRKPVAEVKMWLSQHCR